MIQIYSPENTDYTKNGDVTLQPVLCDLEAELNGAWVLTLTVPVDDEGRFSHVKTGAAVSAPTFVSEKQWFRIFNTVVDDLEVTAYARPIFMDSAGEVFLMDKRPSAKNGQQALDEMLSGQTKYKGSSDILSASTAYYIRKNLIEALQSDEDNSFLNRWGGEILYDNYTIIVNKRIGADKGLRVEMGYNCTGLEADINTDEVATRIIPVAYNGYLLPGDKPWVDSPLIDHYPTIKTKEIKFDDVKLKADAQEGETAFETLEEVHAELIKRCQEQFEHGVDKPSCNYKCDMIDLAETDAYADLKELVQVGLGDTAHCKNKNIGIETDARVIRITYDCIQKANKSVELGAFSYNYFNQLSSAMNRVDGAIDENGNIRGERVNGILDGMQTQMRVQNTVAKKTTSPSFLSEDLDPNSETFGAMCFGTQGFCISNERNADNTGWVWSTFGTSKGFFADYLFAGKLLSKNFDEREGKGFMFDLDSGEIVANTISSYDPKHKNKTIIENSNIDIYDKHGERCGCISPERLTDDNHEEMDWGISISAGNIAVRGEGEPFISMYKDAKELRNYSKIIRMYAEEQLYLSSKQIMVSDPKNLNGHYKAETGKAVFSDDSYLKFVNGILVGGKTASGTEF